jgi:peroxiredoxin
VWCDGLSFVGWSDIVWGEVNLNWFMMESLNLKTYEGLFVVHLFLNINAKAWNQCSRKAQEEGLERFTNLLRHFNEGHQQQAKLILMGGKADLGLMLLGPDRVVLLQMERELMMALGDDILHRVYSYFSMTETSEYTTSEDEYRKELLSQGLEAGTESFEKELAIRLDRLKSYTQDRLYPRLPDWRFFCFYPMSKRRLPGANWYELAFEERKALMKGHAMIGRKYSGKVLQLVSGSIGLDDWEWGVTLFAHDAREVKAIVTEMRYDMTSARYAEFGSFYTGIQAPIHHSEISLQRVLSRFLGTWQGGF